MPLQVSPSGKDTAPIARPIAVTAFVDSAKILGLPKLKLRDSSGNLYLPNKALLQEPFALIYQHAGMPMVGDVTARKTYISAYVRGR